MQKCLLYYNSLNFFRLRLILLRKNQKSAEKAQKMQNLLFNTHQILSYSRTRYYNLCVSEHRDVGMYNTQALDYFWSIGQSLNRAIIILNFGMRETYSPNKFRVFCPLFACDRVNRI